ncbi:hypothetical protein PTT_01262 [Pyrenophora teres f. teres 0-1]|uniref:Peptidase C15, pyroglutamyl peptidase I-like protein n=1 Tax=Pyrenophora teres f. teres (strain 0-1) TaxID=861557 RepID=E3RCY0_PYRTT|nr:hypothetical protein PTT_01262 [Pyrenophora teres f. teres 0-1]
MAPQVYAAIQPPSEEGEKPVTVLVTGFGPFLSKYPQNSSWTIASTLPALLPATPQNPTPIHIHTHHAPIRVSYNTVLDLIPTLLPPGNPMYPVPDIILHIGLAAGRSYYAIESTARGRGYGQIADVDGIRFSDEEAEERFPGNMYPRTLETGFEMGDVLGRWKGFLGGSKSGGTKDDGNTEKIGAPDVRISHDAGNFLCGFIYYNSLAHYFEKGKEGERPVIFLHVPDLSKSEEEMREGWGVTVALIKVLVESRRVAGGKVGGGQGGVNENGDGKEGVSAGNETDNNFA